MRITRVAEEFVKVADASKVPEGSMKMVKIGDTEVFFECRGNYHAIGNICTYRGARLSDGVMQGNIVTCPWHLSQFDVTSAAAIAEPASRPEPHYEVKIDGARSVI